MALNTTPCKLLRIITNEKSVYKHTPFYEAVVFAAKRSKLSGATVYRGIMSYGEESKIKNFRFFAISQDLPVIIDIVDNESAINQFCEIVIKMINKAKVDVFITISETNTVSQSHQEL